MRRPQWLAVILACLLSIAAAAPDGGDEMEYNRRLLEKRKADPEHYQRLKRDLAAFYALPPQRQEQIRDLDRQLHDADPATQARHWAVIERYHAWLEQLPEPERQAVLEAPDKVTVIRGLRQREWIERLPRAIRDELARLPAEKRIARIKQLRQQEQQQRVLWQRALGGANDPISRPTKPGELPREAQTFLDKEILPRLNDQEKKSLKQAEGHWPEYPRNVAWLADRYPVLPEGPQGKIVSAGQLPSRTKERLERNRKAKLVARQEGKWPEYALAVSDALRGDPGLLPLGASRPDEFPPAVSAFLRNKLLPALPLTARTDLERCEGRWPDYPRRLLTYARRHQLVIPGMSLPGPPEVWEAARVARQEQGGDDVLEAIAADPKFGRGPGLDWLIKAGSMKKPGGGKPGWPGGKGHR